MALCLEDGYEFIRRIRIIIFLCIITCASWLTFLRESGSEFVWDLVYEWCLSVGMFLGATVGSSLEYLIIMLLVLSLRNYSGTWELYLVGLSLGTLAGLLIGTVEGYLVGLSLAIPLGSPI